MLFSRSIGRKSEKSKVSSTLFLTNFRYPRLMPNLTLVILTLSFSTVFLSAYAGSVPKSRRKEFAERSFVNSNSIKMQSARNDGMGGRGVTYIPSSGTYSNVVIWMHGLGDTADGWASMMPSLGITDTKFIVPTAKSRSITINRGMPMPGWFDIFDLDENSAEDEAGFADSTQRIEAFIQAEVDKGVPSNKIVVAGFSQGGAVALHTALRSTHSLGGCIALSTWLPFRAQYPGVMSAAASHLKVLQVHGDEDQVVDFHWGHNSHKVLKTILSDPAPEFITIEGMGHSSDPEEMIHIQRFLKSIFGQ